MKKAISILMVIILSIVLFSCSGKMGSEKNMVTPKIAIQGYWTASVMGITISYKFVNGSYYGTLSAIVEGQDIDTGFSYWGKYTVDEKNNLIILTLEENGSTSNMRYVFKNGKITHLATIDKNGSEGAALTKISDLK